MYQENLLRAAMTREKKTLNDCANCLGLSVTGFWNKLANHSEFTASEINKLSALLNLEVRERESIFFGVDVEK